VESSQNRASAGSTCLSVTKVPPDYATYIPQILGGDPMVASPAKPFFPERKASERERENGHYNREKTLSELSVSPDVAPWKKTRVLNCWLGHICVCISV
jgi:hypothetical protein